MSSRGMINFATGTIDAPKEMKILPNVFYWLGASSSPDRVLVTAVDDRRITYVKWPYFGAKEQRIETWVGQDLIYRGTSTAAEQGYPGAKEALAGHGKKVDIRDYEQFRVVVTAADEAQRDEKTLDRKFWDALGQYGNVGGQDFEGQYALNVELTKDKLEDLKKDHEFKILKIEPIKARLGVESKKLDLKRVAEELSGLRKLVEAQGPGSGYDPDPFGKLIVNELMPFFHKYRNSEYGLGRLYNSASDQPQISFDIAGGSVTLPIEQVKPGIWRFERVGLAGESPSEVDKVFDKLEGEIVRGEANKETAKKIAKVIEDAIWVAFDVLSELNSHEEEESHSSRISGLRENYDVWPKDVKSVSFKENSDSTGPNRSMEYMYRGEFEAAGTTYKIRTPSMGRSLDKKDVENEMKTQLSQMLRGKSTKLKTDPQDRTGYVLVP